MALLSQASRADRTFERLYRRHAGAVYRYAYGVLQNRADAEDVTQTTFMNAYRAIERGERPATPHNWLIAIAHNVCRQRFRQSQRRPSEVAWQSEIADTLVVDDDAPSADDLRRALAVLPFNQRAALVLRELEGRSYAEIAELLELSVSAVETLIFRARRAVREQLEGALTCSEAEVAISKQLDKRLPRAEKGALRAHLRECPACATLARRQRGQRSALRSLGSFPLPAAISSLLGSGGGGAATLVAAKAAAVVTAAAVVGGGSYEAVHEALPHRRPAAMRATVTQAVAATVTPAPAPATPVSSPRIVSTAAPLHARGRFAGHGLRHDGEGRAGFGLGLQRHDGSSTGDAQGGDAAVAAGAVRGHHGLGLRSGSEQGNGHGFGHDGSFAGNSGAGEGSGHSGSHGRGYGFENAAGRPASFPQERHLHLRTCPRPHPGILPPAGSGDAGAGEPDGSPASPSRSRSGSVSRTKGEAWGSSTGGTQSSAGQC